MVSGEFFQLLILQWEITRAGWSRGTVPDCSTELRVQTLSVRFRFPVPVQIFLDLLANDIQKQFLKCAKHYIRIFGVICEALTFYLNVQNVNQHPRFRVENPRFPRYI